jgi:zinc transporter ZupT
VLADWWIALAFAAGGLVHVLVEFLLEQIPLCHESEDRRRMWMICTAVAMDLIKQ